MKDILKDKKCIGIMGGTFNPVHNGHILMAKSAYEQFDDMEKVIFLPNNQPKYKETKDIVAPEHRVNMLNIALKECDFACVSDMEIKRGGITYTYDTLTEILNYNPALQIYYIIGSDSLKSFASWYRYKDVLSMCTLLCACRDNDRKIIKSVGDELLKDSQCGRIEYITMAEYDAASSDIRRDIAKGYMPSEILPAGVPDYILKNNLYG